MPCAKILIVEDENAISHLIKSHMKKEGFLAFSAQSGKEALKIIKEKEPDLIILDNMLPDMTGVETCLEIRKTNNVPIIFISHKSEEADKIIALTVGGDDYITKPFLLGELTARIKALLRRRNMDRCAYPASEERILEFPGLTVNTLTREIFVNGIAVYLTAKEFDILSLFIEQPKRIYRPEEIFEYVWKTNAIRNDRRTVMVYISTLRKKIEYNPDNPKYIINIRRVGYMFNHHLLV